MAQIEQVLARMYVDDLDVALPLCERLATDAPVRRFGFGGLELAWVGPFLLLAGTAEDLAPFRDRVATLLVDDIDAIDAIDAIATEVSATGGQVLEGPAPGPNGSRLIARHPDRAVFEYLHITA